MAIFDYIEGFYNTWRRHSSIGNLCPDEYETPLARQRRFRQCCMNPETRCPSDPGHSRRCGT